MSLTETIPLVLKKTTAPLRIVQSRESLETIPLPARVKYFPELRYMGSKHRLLPWIHSVLDTLDFETAADPFVGSGAVSYLLKAMGKRVVASDFLNFPATLATATIENSRMHLDGPALKKLLNPVKNAPGFIENTFSGVFYTRPDLRFLDRISHSIQKLDHPHQQALALAALFRSCLKKQPRGVFTFTGNRYDDGRRDLRLSIEEHFLEQIEVFNTIVFDNGRCHTVRHADVFNLRPRGTDLVYLDPPYVPRSDDNCYVKRYHFLEGLSCYWRGLEIMKETKVKKISKRSLLSATAALQFKHSSACFTNTETASLSSPIARTAFPIKRCSSIYFVGTKRKYLRMKSLIDTTLEHIRQSNAPK